MAAPRAAHTDGAVELAISESTKKMGYSQLRPKQAIAVKSFVQGQDVFVCLPTGGGKSLCYCILPLVFDHLQKTEEGTSLVVVVSPLVSLMKDQVQAMMKRGMTAVYVGDCKEGDADDVCCGKFQLIYMSPESLLTDTQWRDMIQSPIYMNNLVALVVDEAHCVRKWGETFRKEFLNIGEARSLVPANVHLMALTATASKKTRQVVCKRLGLVRPYIISESPNRPNIKYTVKVPTSMEETFASLVEDIRRCHITTNKSIIFCRTYDDCSLIYMFLRNRLGKEGVNPVGAPDLARFRVVDMFTACTHPEVKETVLKNFILPNGVLRVVVATIAFGMGLDCPNVRRVIHWGPSSDIELYVQETGRAGRDGLPAQALLYYVSRPSNRFIEEDMKTYCKNKEKCRRQVLLQDFDGVFDTPVSCSCCDVCELQCVCSTCFSQP